MSTTPRCFIFCTAIAIGVACECLGQQHNEITNSIGIKMVFIPKRTFMMGSPTCEDRHGKYPEGPLVDPIGPDLGGRRVARGGSYLLGFEDLCRSASRMAFEPTYQFVELGFRVVLEMRPD